MSNFKLTTIPENAQTFEKWLKERNGIAHWRSLNLSDPGRSWSSPMNRADGTPTTKPHWSAENQPDFVVTDIADVGVINYKEVKRFHIAMRIGSQGMTAKLTDGSTRKVNRAVAKAGKEATYVFDYSTQEAVILVPDKVTSLKDWLVQHVTSKYISHIKKLRSSS